ncbi:porin family protein [Ferruginibacter sp. HRS2-29]|uniref:porin family protein n=1 Tax=Ferruginibacter sp. HRS2-29 TaxID=2487334 RepID=UPI0020CF0E90|nr:porin family protein [Ferruginibacter sp. HRS2-29]MCP9753000.1 PorT family protein [Ferruginibacter sp. HRS2-29]
MKNKILLTLFVGVFTFSFAQAQTPVKFGVKAGLSNTGMRGDAVNNLSDLLDFTDGMVKTTNRNGFFAGGYVNIPLDNMLSFEPGIYYTQKGYNLAGEPNVKGFDFLGANAKAQLQSQYIDIPVLLKADLGGFQIFAGPQFSYLVKSDLRMTAGVLGFNLLDRKIDATDQFNRWDAGITGGVGFNVSKNINISASYDYGLQKVDANKNVNAYNRGFKVGIGVGF